MNFLVENGLLIDGKGSASVRGNIGIEGDKIVYVGSDMPPSERVIDAEGLVVSPGFIDIHTHADYSLFLTPDAQNHLFQGVTTIIVGNCGLSAAPVASARKDEFTQTMSAILPEIAEVPLEWIGLGSYLDHMHRVHPSVNVGTFVGHSTLRLAALGLDQREPTKEELTAMKALLSESLTEGALGLSTGLIYVPGIFAKTAEITELCKIVSEHRGIYVSHIRGEAGTLIRAVQEALDVGRATGVPVQISHHKAVGRDNWGKVGITLEMMQSARLRGLDVACDVYPYHAGSTSLLTLIPSWILSGGKTEASNIIRSRRSEVVASMETRDPGEERPLVETGAENIVISQCKEAPELEGKTLSEVASARKISAAELVLDLFEKYGNVSVVLFEMSDEDVTRVLKHQLSMVISDSFGVPGRGKPHPRLYGAFSRVISKYVREVKLLTLQEAIRKMTSTPAERIGLRDRGVLAAGKKADIAIFDSNSVKDEATFADPIQLSKGMHYVFVNGKLAIDDGSYTGARNGEILRKKQREEHAEQG